MMYTCMMRFMHMYMYIRIYVLERQKVYIPCPTSELHSAEAKTLSTMG